MPQQALGTSNASKVTTSYRHLVAADHAEFCCIRVLVIARPLPLRLEGQVPPRYQRLCRCDARPGTTICPTETPVDIARLLFAGFGVLGRDLKTPILSFLEQCK